MTLLADKVLYCAIPDCSPTLTSKTTEIIAFIRAIEFIVIYIAD